MDQQELLNAVKAFVSAEDWDGSRRVLNENRDLLLSDEADAMLEALLDEFVDQPQPTALVRVHRDLLKRCREIGVDAAFAELQAIMKVQNQAPEVAEEYVNAVQALITAPTLPAKQTIITERQALLFTDVADKIFEALLQQFEGQEQQLHLIRIHRDLVLQCRLNGIKSTFKKLQSLN